LDLQCGCERSAKIAGQAGEGGQGFRSWGFENLLHCSGDFCGLCVAEHAEIAGEFVGDGQSFESRCFGERAGGGFGCGSVEEIETFAESGEMALPEVGEKCFDFSVVVIRHCHYWSDETGAEEVARTEGF
jgi:hypothetical protein